MKLLAIAAALFACVGMAQLPPDAANLRMDGIVTDADTGQPLENARIDLIAGGKAIALSAADGSFSIPLIAGHAYMFRVTGDGYVPEQRLLRRMGPCSPCKMNIVLHARMNLGGRVVADDTKEPIARVLVEALRVSPDSGAIGTSAADNAVTDRNGEFTLTRLPPGQYFFRFTPTPSAASLIVADAHEPTPQFIRQWWPGGDAWRKASPFTVLPGTAFRLPDVQMRSVARFQVSGTIQPAACQPGDAYMVSIGSGREGGVKPSLEMMVRCGAEFVFPNLAPGKYMISLLAKDQGEVIVREEVIVADRNLLRNLPPAPEPDHATP